LLDLCTENRGVFIKVGQHLGALDYLLPTEYIQTLRVLHSQAPFSSLEDVFSVIKEDLKLSVRKIKIHAIGTSFKFSSASHLIFNPFTYRFIILSERRNIFRI